MINIKDLPKPICKLGYPDTQLKEIFTKSEIKKLNKYLYGQTGAICTGREYIESKTDTPYVTKSSNCGPHGMVVYKCDIETFLENRPTLD